MRYNIRLWTGDGYAYNYVVYAQDVVEAVVEGLRCHRTSPDDDVVPFAQTFSISAERNPDVAEHTGQISNDQRAGRGIAADRGTDGGSAIRRYLAKLRELWR